MFTLFWSVLIFVVGTFLAKLYPIVIGLAGAPGALLAGLGENGRSPRLYRLGFIVCAIGQIYSVLLFAAIVIGMARTVSAERELVSWIVLGAAALTPGAAVESVVRDSRHAIRLGEVNVQHMVAGLLAPAVFVGTIALLFFPEAAAPWAWAPGVSVP